MSAEPGLRAGFCWARAGLYLALLVALSMGSACAGREPSPAVKATVAGETSPSATRASLPSLPRWAYMLQNDVSAEVAGTDFNLVVMDYTKDATDDYAARYSQEETSSIKNSGAGRVMLAYLSIGEAEAYRYYFDLHWTDDPAGDGLDPDAPDWLGRANPSWEGNYKVRYWSEEWQQIVLDYLDKIIAYGFDGVYLDIVDGFEYWSDEESGEALNLAESHAAARMIAFVARIAAHARTQDEDFFVVPQNGERLLGFDPNGAYLEVIDGIGVEDLFYDGSTALPSAVWTERAKYLDAVLAAGKPVLVVDYVYAGSRDLTVDEFVTRATAAGYFPYAAGIDRELDRLVVFAGQGK